MTPEMINCLAEVAGVLAKLNRTLEAEILEMQRGGIAPSKIEHVRAGAKAIKDCGNMLLVWSDYIARGDLADPAEDPEAYPDPYPR